MTFTGDVWLRVSAEQSCAQDAYRDIQTVVRVFRVCRKDPSFVGAEHILITKLFEGKKSITNLHIEEKLWK